MVEKIIDKALIGNYITVDEAIGLWNYAPLQALKSAAHNLRMKLHPAMEVTWIIDRNVNITNVCISGCKFCNFHCTPLSQKAYVTSIEQYREKISVLFALGGRQLLLQGGLHPKLGLEFYEDLFRKLKHEFPALKLHALGPPEIVHLSHISKLSYRKVLERLIAAGLDSLPGAGAEILSDRVRKILSPGKCKSDEWLEVMRQAHTLGLVTSATMMLGHIETIEERFVHLEKIRALQTEKPHGVPGFLSFIPWPFQDKNTELATKMGITNCMTDEDYIRFIAISRLMLVNIPNIQASWLTVGIPVAQQCLHAGANDMGSVMIEENVVSSAGADYRCDALAMQQAIRAAGFIPRQRNQQFEYIENLVNND